MRTQNRRGETYKMLVSQCFTRHRLSGSRNRHTGNNIYRDREKQNAHTEKSKGQREAET